MDAYLKTAMERAMKIREVILRAVAKRVRWQHLDGKFTITYDPQRLER